MEQKTWTTTKGEDSIIQAVEMKFLGVILNKTKEDRIRETNIKLELGVNEIKNYIQKSRLRWFGNVMQMKEERIPKKIIHTKNGGKTTKRKT